MSTFSCEAKTVFVSKGKASIVTLLRIMKFTYSCNERCLYNSCCFFLRITAIYLKIQSCKLYNNKYMIASAHITKWQQRDSSQQPLVCKRTLTGWVFVYELSGCGFKSRCCHLNFRYRVCFEQGVLNIQAIIGCRFTLKRIHDMIVTYRQQTLEFSHSYLF